MITDAAGMALSRRIARGWLFRGLLPISMLGCDEATKHARNAPSTFNTYFRTAAEVKLEDRPGDPIGDIGNLFEARNGDLILTDPIRHQIRRYTPGGALVAVQGRYGSGPFEYQQIAGAVEDEQGAIIVADSKLQRLTRLRAGLQEDSMFKVRPAPRGLLVSVGEGTAMITASGPRATSLSMEDERWMPMWTVPAPSPGPITSYPYWNSFGVVLMTAATPYVVTAFSLRYPIYLLSARSGARVDSLTAAPAGFRHASVLKAGAFGGADAAVREDEWLASFNVISHLCVLKNRFLIVTHGDLQRTSTSLAKNEHRRFDIYDLRHLTRIAENVPLREGARVLNGGNNLYILVDQPPSSWTIVRAELRL